MPKTHAIQKDNLILHLTVFIWAFTGLLGKIITLDAVRMVWYRVAIAIITLFVYLIFSKTPLKVNRKDFINFFCTGAIVAAHWIFFFHSIKVSTVAVGMVCLSSITLFTAIIEPIFKKNNISSANILVGLLIIFGIYLIFKFETKYTVGIFFGLLTAVAGSTFTTINSIFIQKNAAPVISFYEFIGAFFWITVYRLFDKSLFVENFDLSFNNWFYLVILGTVCTAIAYLAGVSVMRNLSAFKVALVTNLEPIYGIVLALLLFGAEEKMTLGFYIGTILIFAAVFLYPIYQNLKNTSSKIIENKQAT